MNKYTAKRGLMVDGKIYNQGDIVFTDNPIDGLELIEEEQRLSEQWTAHKILRDCKVSNYITKEKPRNYPICYKKKGYVLINCDKEDRQY